MVNIRDPKPPRFIRQTSQPDTPLARAKVRIAKTKARQEAIKKAQNQLAEKYTSQGYQVNRDAQGNPRKAIKQSGSRKEIISLDTQGRVRRISRDLTRGNSTRTVYRINFDYNRGRAIEKLDDNDGTRDKKNYYFIDAQGNKYKYKEKKYDNDGKLRKTTYFNPNTGRRTGTEKARSRQPSPPSLAERRKRRKELERQGLSPIQAARKETQEFSDVVSKPSVNTGGRVAQRAKEEGGFRLAGQGAESAGGRRAPKFTRGKIQGKIYEDVTAQEIIANKLNENTKARLLRNETQLRQDIKKAENRIAQGKADSRDIFLVASGGKREAQLELIKFYNDYNNFKKTSNAVQYYSQFKSGGKLPAYTQFARDLAIQKANLPIQSYPEAKGLILSDINKQLDKEYSKKTGISALNNYLGTIQNFVSRITNKDISKTKINQETRDYAKIVYLKAKYLQLQNKPKSQVTVNDYLQFRKVSDDILGIKELTDLTKKKFTSQKDKDKAQGVINTLKNTAKIALATNRFSFDVAKVLVRDAVFLANLTFKAGKYSLGTQKDLLLDAFDLAKKGISKNNVFERTKKNLQPYIKAGKLTQKGLTLAKNDPILAGTILAGLSLSGFEATRSAIIKNSRQALIEAVSVFVPIGGIIKGGVSIVKGTLKVPTKLLTTSKRAIKTFRFKTRGKLSKAKTAEISRNIDAKLKNIENQKLRKEAKDALKRMLNGETIEFQNPKVYAFIKQELNRDKIALQRQLKTETTGKGKKTSPISKAERKRRRKLGLKPTEELTVKKFGLAEAKNFPLEQGQKIVYRNDRFLVVPKSSKASDLINARKKTEDLKAFVNQKLSRAIQEGFTFKSIPKRIRRDIKKLQRPSFTKKQRLKQAKATAKKRFTKKPQETYKTFSKRIADIFLSSKDPDYMVKFLADGRIVIQRTASGKGSVRRAKELTEDLNKLIAEKVEREILDGKTFKDLPKQIKRLIKRRGKRSEVRKNLRRDYQRIIKAETRLLKDLLEKGKNADKYDVQVNALGQLSLVPKKRIPLAFRLKLAKDILKDANKTTKAKTKVKSNGTILIQQTKQAKETKQAVKQLSQKQLTQQKLKSLDEIYGKVVTQQRRLQKKLSKGKRTVARQTKPKTITKSLPKNKSARKSKVATASELILKVSSKLRNLNLSKNVTATKLAKANDLINSVKPALKVISKSKLGLAKTTKSKVDSASKNISKTISRVKQLSKQVPKKAAKTKTKQKSKPKKTKKTRITFNTKLPRGFEYIVDGRIKKGNRVRTVRLRTTPNRARKRLQKLVDNKLIASYDIVAVGAKRAKDIQPPKSKKFRLRRGADPKVRKYVELKKYRLDTAGEKRQLQKKRKVVKRKRKATKKKSKRRTTKKRKK